MRHPCASLVLSLAVFAPLAAAGDDHWPEWRGPFGTGVAVGDAPTTWSDDENVKWISPLPGRAFSTPIVWGDRIFLTTAVPTGEEQEQPKAPEPRPERGEGGQGGDRGDRGRGRFGGGGGRGGFGGFGRGAPPTEHVFLALCLDRATGDVIWEKKLNTATPHEGFHRTYGSFASTSPVTDGEHVYFSFGSRGLYCLDFDGELVWERDFEVQMRIAASFGEGSAPTLVGNMLVHNFDHEGDSFIVAVDKRTGKDLWRVEREERTSWGSPLPVEVDGKLQIITTGSRAVRSYAGDTGALVWECSGLGSNPIPTPIRHGDTILVMSGHRSPNMMAIALGGEGDLTDTDAVHWSLQRGVPYTATPVLFEGRLYAVTDRGMLSCIDATTGEPYYFEERLPRGAQLKASPVVAGGNLYIATESGDVHVIEAGEEYKLVATNTLEGQFFVSSPIVVEGELFLRSGEALYCIAEEQD